MLKQISFLLALTTGIISATAAGRPNVLFVSVDDLNDWVNVFGGHPQVKTPHIENFAASGSIVFHKAHCAGPVCGPSRSALLSGFMPNRTGLYGNSNNMLDSSLVQAHATANGRDCGQWAFDLYETGTGAAALTEPRSTRVIGT